MAIQLSYTSSQGVVATKAYHRVNAVNYTTESNSHVKLNIYQSIGDYEKGNTPLDMISFEFSMDITDDGANPIKQAYNSLTSNKASMDMGGSSSKTTMSKMGYNTQGATKI